MYEVARELGMSSREVMDHLQGLGHPVGSHSSNLDDSVVADLKSDLESGMRFGEMHASSSSAGEDETRSDPEPEPAPGTPVAVAERAPPSQEAPERSAEAAEPPSEPPREKRAGALRRSRLRRTAKHLAELPLLVVFAFLIAVLVKTFLVQAFYIPSGSMQPTLQIRDRVLVEKVGYRISGPSRGQVIVFEREGFGIPDDLGIPDRVRIFMRELLGLPTGAREDYIKRVVAVGGDSIRYAGRPRVLEVNGEAVEEPYLPRVDRNSAALNRRHCDRLDMERTEQGCRVPAGTVFVMGDNRGNSEDSRAFGPIEVSEVVGRAVLLIWPPSHFGTL